MLWRLISEIQNPVSSLSETYLACKSAPSVASRSRHWETDSRVLHETLMRSLVREPPPERRSRSVPSSSSGSCATDASLRRAFPSHIADVHNKGLLPVPRL